MALLVRRLSQTFVPLISCAITFDQTYIFTRKFFKIVFASLSIGKFNIRYAAVCFLTHSVAVAALSRISHLACRARDFLLPVGFSEPSFQILHGVRSWVFIDTFIHYAPQILHSVYSWRRSGPAYCRYKIWQIVVVVAVFFFFLCTMLGWLWLCVLAHSLGRGIQSLALPVMQKELGSPETPKQYHFFGLGTAETGIYDISPKTKIVLFFRSTVFVLLNRFQASCTLRGSKPKFLLPSTFAFHEPPDGVFPSNILF